MNEQTTRGSHLGRGRSLTDAVRVAVAVAMVATALEFLVLAWRLAASTPIYQGLDIFWAKPITNLALFVPLGAAASVFPERWRLPLLLFPAIAAPLLLLVPGSPLPMLILAAGVAARTGSMLRPRHRVARIEAAGAALGVAFLCIATVTQVTRAARERGTAGGPVAANEGAPNVLLLILDTVRAASLRLYGGRAATPSLEALASRGVTYDRAISPSPWTLPSHASLFTGLWPHEHGADWRTRLPPGMPTLAEVLGSRGYRTGGFVANLIYTSREHGLQRGFEVYRDYRRSPGAIIRASALGQFLLTTTIGRRVTGYYDVAGRKSARAVNREFLDWEAARDGAPWFAFLNYFDAHAPWLPPAPYAGRYSAGLPQRRFDLHHFWSVEGGIGDWGAMSAGEVEAERAAYEEAITALDADIGALLDTLRQRGELERTLIIVTSDHGELFGEHATYSHGNSLYWRTVHVPLLMAWPGRVQAGERVPSPVSLRDLPATILRLAQPEAGSLLPGTPLPPSGAPGSLVLAEVSVEEFSRDDPPMKNGSLQSVTGADWTYLRAASGVEEALRVHPGWADSVVSQPSLRAALLDSGRALVRQHRIPPPHR